MRDLNTGIVIVLVLLGVGAAVVVLRHPGAGTTVWDVMFIALVGAFLIAYLRSLHALASSSMERMLDPYSGSRHRAGRS